jgi:SAM-dependent methyltransferase
MPEWFQSWFNDDYLALYPHRDAAEAAQLVALVGRTTRWTSAWRILDVGCGPGRHAAALAGAGLRPIGLDLSSALLRRAREVTSAPLVRADMRRLPVRPGSMDACLSLFTSFGYFESDAEHAETLAGMAATLRPGGWFVMDFLNAAEVRSRVASVPGPLEPGERGSRLRKYLSPDQRFVIKEIHLADGRQFSERVRLYHAADLEAMLLAAGIAVEQRFGDYEGARCIDGSPRALLLGRAA